MTVHTEQLAAARWVLHEALGAGAGSTVLIVHDEDTRDVALVFGEAARSLRLTGLTSFVPAAEQRDYASSPDRLLDQEISDKIGHASRIVLLQRWDARTAHFRFLVLRAAESAPNRRAASMPGITLASLHACGGDLKELEARCRLVADRMVWARSATVRTESRAMAGKVNSLAIPITAYLPIISSGRITRGWGNVPSGETFVVPNLAEAHGAVTINGSAPDYPLGEEEFLEVNVLDGRVQPGPSCGGNAGSCVPRLLYTDGGVEAAFNCTVVSELGFGLNPRVTEFTGLPILDEKILGTVHLGFGRSDQFGGPTRCTMHNDFVIKGATVHLDETLVIDEGRFVMGQPDVFPNWRSVSVRHLDPGSPIRRTGSRYGAQKRGPRVLAVREWVSPRGAAGALTTQIGDEETAYLAYRYLDALEDTRVSKAAGITQEKLCQTLCHVAPAETWAHVAELLLRFGLIEQDNGNGAR